MWQAAGAAASVLGGIIKTIAANQAKHAMEKAFKNELNRQGGYRQEAFGHLQGAFPTYGVETARQQMAAGQAHREGLYGDVGNLSFSAEQPSGFGPSESDKANLQMAGNARAKLGSYSDWQLDQMINRIRVNDELNRINDFARGTAEVYPYRMYDAQHSADDLAFLGDLISSVGGAAGAFGGMGGMFGGGGGMTGMYDAPQGFGQQFGNIV